MYIEADNAPVELTANESAGKPDEIPKEKELTSKHSTERVESAEDSSRLENVAATYPNDSNEKRTEELTVEHDGKKSV